MALLRTAGWLLLLVVLAGCAGRSSPTGSLASSTPVSDDSGTILGLVVDDEQVPIEGADVWVLDDEPRRDITDAEGRFVIPGVMPGEHGVAAIAKGHMRAEQKVGVPAGESVEVTLIIEPIPLPVPRTASYTAEAIIEFGVNAFGVYYYRNESGTEYRDVFYDVAPDVKSAVIGLQWTAVSPVSAKWMRLGLYLSDRQCVRVCDLVQDQEGRSPLIARGDDLDVRIMDRGGALTVNPYIAIEPPCTIGAPTTCTEQPDAVVQAAQDQRFQLYTSIFYVEPAPAGFNPLPAP